MEQRVFWLSVLAVLLAALPPSSPAQSRASGDVVAANIEFRDGRIQGNLRNTTSHRVRDVALRIRYFWVWKVKRRTGAPGPELSFEYTVEKEIPPRGMVPFSYTTSPLPARRDGYYEIEVTVARSVNVDSLASSTAGRAPGARPRPDLKTHRHVAITVEDVVVQGAVVSGKVRNRAPHRVRDVELLIRHVWVPNNEYKPGPGDLGKSAYHTVWGEIQPGGSIPFTYGASPLPSRTDGKFQTRVAVAGFQEIGRVELEQDRDPPRERAVSRGPQRAGPGAMSGPARVKRDGAGPHIDLLSPRRSQKIALGTVMFEATVEDASGIENVEVWLNDAKVPSGVVGPAGRKRVTVERTIPIERVGINCFKVVARNGRGNTARERVCLVATRKPSPRQAPAAVRSAAEVRSAPAVAGGRPASAATAPPPPVPPRPAPSERASAPAPVAPPMATNPDPTARVTPGAAGGGGLSMERKVEILKRYYLEEQITARQFDRAVQTLESGQQNRLLEDFIKGDISPATFRRAF